MILAVSTRQRFASFRRASHARAGSLTVRYLPVAEAVGLEVAFAIGRRAGNAVIRNRIRRRLREALRLEADAGHLPIGAVMIGSSPGSLAVPFAQLRIDITRLIRLAKARQL